MTVLLESTEKNKRLRLGRMFYPPKPQLVKISDHIWISIHSRYFRNRRSSTEVR